MSENVTLAKSRKKLTITVNEGDYFVLVQPTKEFNSHLQVYREIAASAPVNEDYERVITGRVNYTSSALNLITEEQDEAKRKLNTENLNRIEDAVKDAQERQEKRMADEQAEKELEHETLLAKKNSMIASIRSDHGKK